MKIKAIRSCTQEIVSHVQGWPVPKGLAVRPQKEPTPSTENSIVILLGVFILVHALFAREIMLVKHGTEKV